MTVHRCPECLAKYRPECPTCGGTRYVHRNGVGEISHPADPASFLAQEERKRRRPRRPSRAGYRRRR